MRIDSAEYSEWLALMNVSPFGDERADLRNAIVAHTVAAAHGAQTKLTDYIPEFHPRQKTPEELQAAFMLWAEMRNMAQG